MSDINNNQNIIPDRSKHKAKPPKPRPQKIIKQNEQPKITKQYQQVQKNVAFIFDKTRDLGNLKAYYQDGDPQMYTPNNIQKRKNLFNDQQIQKQLENISNYYTFNDDELRFQNYKKIHQKLALILRPDIDEEQLQFIVKKDYQYDSKDGRLSKKKLKEKLFQMVDIWTMGAQKLQYLCFIRLLKVKLGRMLNTTKK